MVEGGKRMQKVCYTPLEVAGMLGISKQTLLRYEKKILGRG
jgi:hypothetical protein